MVSHQRKSYDEFWDSEDAFANEVRKGFHYLLDALSEGPLKEEEYRVLLNTNGRETASSILDAKDVIKYREMEGHIYVGLDEGRKFLIENSKKDGKKHLGDVFFEQFSDVISGKKTLEEYIQEEKKLAEISYKVSKKLSGLKMPEKDSDSQ